MLVKAVRYYHFKYKDGWKRSPSELSAKWWLETRKRLEEFEEQDHQLQKFKEQGL